MESVPSVPFAVFGLVGGARPQNSWDTILYTAVPSVPKFGRFYYVGNKT